MKIMTPDSYRDCVPFHKASVGTDKQQTHGFVNSYNSLSVQ